MAQWKVVTGDCIAVMKGLPDNSFDSMCTDPPSGTGFMGKDWDCFRRRHNPADVGRDSVHGRMSANAPHSYGESDRGNFIAFMTEVMQEALRVLKPGAHCLVWALPRTSHWTATALEDAGFEVRDCITHHFGSGFPKSQDVGKFIDKAAGDAAFLADRQKLARHIREKRQQDGLSIEQVMEWFPHRSVVRNWERLDAGNRVPTVRDYEVLIEELDCGAEFREFVRTEAERLIIGHATGGIAQGWARQGEAGYKADYALTVPATEGAKEWDGWGTALKPATEHWILCRKPLSESSIARNVLKHGTGALNIDACRVNRASDDVPGWHKTGSYGRTGGYLGTDTFKIRDMPPEEVQERCGDKGRWPPNLLLTCSCDEPHDDPTCPVAELDRQAPKVGGGYGVRGSDAGNTMYGGGKGLQRPSTGQAVGYGDSGGASRFFPTFKYQAKPSSSERNAGLDEHPDRTLNRVNPGGIENDPRWAPVQVKNSHPTLKSISLMKWLCSLITPAGGYILDPFLGSGSTGCAAVQLGYGFYGCDKDPEYVAIAESRIRYWEAKAQAAEE